MVSFYLPSKATPGLQQHLPATHPACTHPAFTTLPVLILLALALFSHPAQSLCSHPPCSHSPCHCCRLPRPGCQRGRKQPRLITNHSAWFCFPARMTRLSRASHGTPHFPRCNPTLSTHPACTPIFQTTQHPHVVQKPKRHHPADRCSHLMAAPPEHRHPPHH